MNEIIRRKSDFLKEEYTLIKHQSGLDIYVFPKDLTTYYGLFATKYGSVDNKFRKRGEAEFTEVPDGIAHFLEHKLFESEDGSDAFVRFARTGADSNAYTSFRTTAYLFSCTENFEESLEILLDFVTSPYFSDESVAKEQGIIGQEIKMCEDNPGRALIFGMLQSLYEKHTVRIETAGTVESISHITPELLYQCYNTFYNLKNMALCVCGRVNADDVIRIADKVLLAKDRPSFDVESVYPEENPEVYRKHHSVKMQVAKPLFDIGVKDIEISADPRERFKKNAAMNIICDVLFGKTGRFYCDLYDEGLISPSFDYWFEHNASYSFVSFSGDSDEPEIVYDRFIRYMEEVLTKGLDPAEIERCRRVMYASFLKSFDSTEEIANNLLTSFAFDGGEIFDYADIIREIDKEYVENVMKSIFAESHYTLMEVLPL